MTFHPSLDRAAELAASQPSPALAAIVLGAAIIATAIFASFALRHF